MSKIRVSLWIAGTALALSAVAARGQAPTLGLSESELTGSLSQASKKKIDAYVKYWTGQMAQADTPVKVAGARLKVLEGYGAYAPLHYQLYYARSAAGQLASVLALADRVKQIQAAMAGEAMPQISIQPLLETMSRHANPAVRYLAASGYRQAARRMMAQGRQYATKMLAALERLGMKDAAGPVVGQVLAALNPGPQSKPAEAGRLRAVARKVWLARCKEVLEAKADFVEAYVGAVGALRAMPDDAADRKVVGQLLLEALEAGSRAYAEPAHHTGRAGEALVELLTGAESALADMFKKDMAAVQEVLGDRKMGEEVKALKARLAVNDAWKPLLAKEGVKVRDLPSPT